MTQAGRQSSPRNSSGRNSSGRNEAKGGTGRSNAGGFSGRGGSAGAGKRNFTQGEGRPFKASKPREAAPFDPDNPTTAGDYDRGQAARPAKPFRKPGSNKPGFGKAVEADGGIQSHGSSGLRCRAQQAGGNHGASRQARRKEAPPSDLHSRCFGHLNHALPGSSRRGRFPR